MTEQGACAILVKPETVITAVPDFKHYWRDSWRFRELLLLLVWRDVLVRYKQTMFGVAWAVLRPFVTMVVFTLLFGRLANLPSHGVPYPLLVFAGILPWQFFANTFVDASNSLVGSASMISKVYFPRIPLSVVVGGVVDLAIAGAIYAIMALRYGHAPGWQIVYLPGFLLLLCLWVLACSLWASALNVTYRDFRYLVPFAVQLGTYVSPVGFSSSVVPARWQFVYALNPMVGIIDGFRWSMLRGSTPMAWESVALSVGITLALLIPGVRFFRRFERSFADVI